MYADPPIPPRIILYTVITGDYEVVPEIVPEPGIDYYLCTDDLATPCPVFWQKRLIYHSEHLASRRLSRFPKIQPHICLPDHDISIYMDANIKVRRPLLQLAKQCVYHRPIAINAHPNTSCLYAEAAKCLRLGLDTADAVNAQISRYRAEGFPEGLGLTENNFIIRRNVNSIKELDILWWNEYVSGSERDQVSFMYCAWRTKVPIHIIGQHSRNNRYYSVHPHLKPRANGHPNLKTYRSQCFSRGLRELRDTLPNNTVMVEVGTASGESANIFASSDKVIRMWCVDRWSRDAAIEAQFDVVKARYPEIIQKIKASSVEAATRFDNQSLDFVYIDATHTYEQVLKDIRTWQPKIKPGGYIGGHDYTPKFPGVVQAVYETFGNPVRVFEDTSWLVRVPAGQFGIITYCTLGYADALALTLNSWIKNSGAKEIVIFTDTPELEQRVGPAGGVRFIHAYGPPAEELKRYPWERKVESLRAFHESTSCQWFAYLDADCWVQSNIRNVFEEMRSKIVLGTRLLGRDGRGKGEANAGVIFFKRDSALHYFFDLWNRRLDEYRQDHGNWLCEQDAFSHIVIEAFDGLHPFQTGVVSEHIYNCEHDDDDKWLADIEKYRPKIIHFKRQRFRNPQLIQTVFGRIGGGPTSYGQNGNPDGQSTHTNAIPAKMPASITAFHRP